MGLAEQQLMTLRRTSDATTDLCKRQSVNVNCETEGVDYKATCVLRTRLTVIVSYGYQGRRAKGVLSCDEGSSSRLRET